LSLFHPRVVAKHARSYEVVPDSHREILNTWAKNVRLGRFERETSHDGEFIQKILIDVLGYTGSSGSTDWTIAKNEPVGRGNVDVALGFFSEDNKRILAPFELKGTKTRDLDAPMSGRNKSPVQQAWEYAMDVPGAKWVLVSNYRELRLYGVGYGRKEFEQFDLTQLTSPTEYSRFLLLLSAENLLGDRTLSLLQESESRDKEITENFYADYRSLRAQMINALSTKNPNVQITDIIQHTQTILDRIIFIAFSEDRGLLPKNTLKSCYEDRSKWDPQPIWRNFRGLFSSIDVGNPPLNIPGYNGGLFAPNGELDTLTVPDELCDGFQKLGEYDFESDVDVNILGHIFEQSITDLEEIRAALTSADDNDDTSKRSKRSKDGIFYTPPVITRYIVEQTVGRWLRDRKSEIGFDALPQLTEVDYASIELITRGPRKGSVVFNKRIEQHIRAWEQYRDALSNIRVLDPACGSGAFLNEVFDYLFHEGQLVNGELTILNAGQARLFRWGAHILANNLYGVDLNKESVEITKLSLWLKTANRNEKLTYLDDNIKCGNSLIDDEGVAGLAAFNWQANFPNVLSDGKFDVVLGNPPWGADIAALELAWIKQQHAHAIVRMVDSYMFFVSKAPTLTKEGGYNGWVIPDSILYQIDNEKLRAWLGDNCRLKVIVNVGDAFEGVARPCAIVVLQCSNGDPTDLIQVGDVSDQSNKSVLYREDTLTAVKAAVIASLPGNIWPTKNLVGYGILTRFDCSLKEFIDEDGIQRGASPDLKDAFILDNATVRSENLEREFVRPTVTGGGDVKRFHIKASKKEIIYVTRDTDPKKIPRIIRYIGALRERITCKEVAEGKHPFYALHRARDERIFKKPRKIVGVITSDRIITAIDEVELYPSDGAYLMSCSPTYSPEFVVGILNSKLMTYFYRLLSGEVGRTMSQVKPKVLETLPAVQADITAQKPIMIYARRISEVSKELDELSSTFLSLLESDLNVSKPGERLEQWHKLDTSSFFIELKKKKVSLSIAAKSEWLNHFERQRAIAHPLVDKIDDMTRDINRLVYDLFGLSEKERAMIDSESA
jgi:hypothetical protein